MKDVLEQACPLTAENRISLYWPEVAVGRIRNKNLDLPFSLGIVGVAVWVDLSRDLVGSLLPARISYVLHIEQRRRGDCFYRAQQYFLRRFIQL